MIAFIEDCSSYFYASVIFIFLFYLHNRINACPFIPLIHLMITTPAHSPIAPFVGHYYSSFVAS